MAIFVDLDEESEPPQTPALRGEWDGERAKLQLQQQLLAVANPSAHVRDGSAVHGDREQAADQGIRENPNRNRMTEALGCYPYVRSLNLNNQLHSSAGYQVRTHTILYL